MKIPKYLDEFIKIKSLGDELEIYFVDIIWKSPHTPESQDVLIYTLPLARWKKEKGKYVSRILNNKKYFRVCGLCGEINHRGHMHDTYICQRCAERHYHAVY
jgi:hypothetical protein